MLSEAVVVTEVKSNFIPSMSELSAISNAGVLNIFGGGPFDFVFFQFSQSFICCSFKTILYILLLTPFLLSST